MSDQLGQEQIDPVLLTKIDKVLTYAIQSCGCSDVLYQRKLQDGLQLIIDQSPVDQRDLVIAAVTYHGYDPEYSPYEPEEGECALTGIDIDCCPCGRHP